MSNENNHCFDYNELEKEFEKQGIEFEKRVMTPEHVLGWLTDFGTEWLEADEMTYKWIDVFWWDYHDRLGVLEVRKFIRDENSDLYLKEVFPDDPLYYNTEITRVTHVRLRPTALKRFIHKGE